MFKALLRTIPSMSGNVKMAFDLSDYEDNNKETVECNIRYGNLLPLSNNLYQRNIKINFLTSSYEFDIHNYYMAYRNIFYNDYFTYEKNDIPLIDIYKDIYLRNTDFEFGLKRTSYQKNKTQFEFFAPVWMDCLDDIPDYFLITLKLKNNYNEKVKKIKINIGSNKDDKRNYIYLYLKKYLSKIDNNVIYCTPFTRQATYYGVSLKYGGFGKFVNNEVVNIYNNFNTIINFDYFLTSGFKRNELIIRQILPFCFRLNIEDFLTSSEQLKFKNCIVDISGKYFKDDKELNFYDFESNYQNFYHNIYKFNNSTGLMDMLKSNINLFDINNTNTLHESKYINYLFTNKLTKTTTKWKLKYSDENNPYIINLNWAYSFIQGSGYKYGFFPQKYNYTTGLASKVRKNESDVKYNLLFPYGTTKEFYEKKNSSTIREYEKIMNDYCFNWFNVIREEDIFSNKKYWKDIEDNKVFYKGILYDFNNIKDLKEKIDKFSIFLKFKINVLESKEANNLIYSNYSLNLKSGSQNNIISNCNLMDNIYDYKDYHFFANNGNHELNVDIPENEIYNPYKGINDENFSYTDFYKINNLYYDNLSENEIFEPAPEGTIGNYIDISDYDIDYYIINRYYNVDEVYNRIYNSFKGKNINNIEAILNDFKETLLKNSVEGYKLLNIFNYTTIEYENDKGDKQNIFTYFINNKSTDKKKYIDLYKRIYFTEKDSPLTKASIYSKFINSTFISSLNQDYVDKKDKDKLYSFTFFLKTNFISFNNLMKLFQNEKENPTFTNPSYRENDWGEDLTLWVNYFKVYYFKPSIKYEGKEKIRDCFVSDIMGRGEFFGTNFNDNQLNHYYDTMWVQQYNLNNIISYFNVYHRDYNNNEPLTYITSAGKKYSRFSYYDINWGHYYNAKTRTLDEKYWNISKEFYCKFLNLIHLKLYNQITYKDIDASEEEYYNTFEKIFIKIKNLDFNNDYTNYYYDINLYDYYIPLKDIIKEEYSNINLYDLIDFSEINNKFYVRSNKYIKGEYQIPEYFDLCFKDVFLRLDDNIMKLINLSKVTTYDKYKDIYIYILEKPEEYFENINLKVSINEYIKEKYDKIKNYWSDAEFKYKKEVDGMLKPFFDDAKLQKMNVTLIYNNFILNKINKVCSKYSNLFFYKYNSNDINFMLELPKEKFFNGEGKLRSDEIEINGHKLSDGNSKTYNKATPITINNIKNNISVDNLNIVDYNGKKYAYYMFELRVNNTSNAFNIIDEYGSTVNLFNYIDSVNVEDFFKNITTDKIFNIFPFLKVNLLNMFTYMNTIVYPKLYNFEMNYKEYPILESYDETDANYTYNIKTVKTKNNINLIRYFDNITPYLVKTEIIKDTFNLKYKDTNDVLLSNSYYINNGESVLFKEDLNINKYNGVNLYVNIDKYNALNKKVSYDKESNSYTYLGNYFYPYNVKNSLTYILDGNEFKRYIPTEYKHFNDNRVINLENYIEYEYKKHIPYEELLELENFENTFKVFKNMILKDNINTYDDDKILFLFNKYTVNYESYPIGLNLTKTKKLYKLIYKFNLL